ncbi:HD domain-containing protein [Candidatus Neptunochlamydia vexilliferae]|uniref:HD domain-containing protein n=1 Tax=Candidatus Neptunichlamydia vexilliferae TaxID=1651774 RepID=UPI001890EBA7|nr:HD domain-containing protein [Candidatus Neptunochlamydia vexilliferae]
MKIYDPVHRFIHLDKLESMLIHTPPFQRLHYIHQLGVTFFVYPGATHRRFEHSLGVMELATRIYDQITFEELPKVLEGLVPKCGSDEHRYWRRVVRLAALCHDLGHLPFSHVAEHRLLGKGGHEVWTQKIMESAFLSPVWEAFAKEAPGHDVKQDVMKVALGEKKFGKEFTPWERVVTEIITGDFFGSDRIDYLLRDSQCTGLAYGLFDYHQLIEMLKIILTPEGNLVLGVEENGVESCEALLLARHYMHKRLYQYSSVKSYSYHLARFMETIYYDLGEDLERYVSMTDNEVLAELNVASRDENHPGHFDAKCLYIRNYRFRAIALSAPPEEEELRALNIPEDEIAWELTPVGKKTIGLNVPVLRQDGTIDVGENLSEISVPPKERSWVYVAPQYEAEIRKKLSHVDALR